MRAESLVLLLDAVSTAVLIRAGVSSLCFAVGGGLMLGANGVYVAGNEGLAWVVFFSSVPFIISACAELAWIFVYMIQAAQRQKVFNVTAHRATYNMVADDSGANDSAFRDAWDSSGVGDSSVRVENTRIVPYRGVMKLTENVPDEDLIHFLELGEVRGFSFRQWRGERLPSGVVIQSWAVWRRYIRVLERGGIVSVSPRSPVVVRVPNALEARELLGLESPDLSD